MTRMSVWSKVHGLCKIIDSNNSSLLCSARTSTVGKLTISLSDGVKVWSCEMSDSDCKAPESDRLRSLFVDGECTTTLSNEKATVTLRSSAKDDKSLTFDLNMLGTSEAQTEISALLFLMAQRSLDLEKKLGQAEKKMGSLQQAVANSSAHSSVFDISCDAKKKNPVQKAVVKQAGMSVLNPGSRKRTKAHGVEFD